MKNTYRFRRRHFLMLMMFPIIILGMMSFGQGSDSPTDNTSAKSPWLDLVTPDLQASQTFYSTLFGWTFESDNHHDLTNLLIKNGNQVIGSIYEIKKAQVSVWVPGIPSANGNLEEKTKQLMKQGCKVAIGEVNIDGRGKQVMLEGPQGEEFSMVSNNYTNAGSMKTTGSVMGCELWASDVKSAGTFYSNAFGVELVEDGDKPHWFFERNGVVLAGLIQNPITNQGTQWVSYFYHNDLEMVASQVTKLGGRVIAGPDARLRNGQMIVIQDPQGALLCVNSIQ